MTCGGKLLEGELEVLDSVTVVVDEAHGSNGSWSGTLLLPPSRFLPAGLYVLCLDDGRSGDVLVSCVATGSEPERVPFLGRGRLV